MRESGDSIMTDQQRVVIGGVDCHLEFHVAVALDERGRVLGDGRFDASTGGYRKLCEWLRSFGELREAGVESTGAYGAGLARHLRVEGVRVIEINQPHPHVKHRRGKTDTIDAELAARKVLSGQATGLAKVTEGRIEAIRNLRVARRSAVKSRTAAIVQLGQVIVTAPAEVREAITGKGLPAKARYCATFDVDVERIGEPVEAGRFALRSIATRIAMLDAEIKTLDEHLDVLVAQVAPSTIELVGVGTHHASQLLASAGENIDRFPNERAFAHLCGVHPIPASSGKTIRYRLNRGGDRQANRALHMIVVCRLRYCERTRTYMERRLAEGRTKPEIIRCLKRYAAREIYRTLRADLTEERT
jgi:transposase